MEVCWRVVVLVNLHRGSVGVRASRCWSSSLGPGRRSMRIDPPAAAALAPPLRQEAPLNPRRESVENRGPTRAPQRVRKPTRRKYPRSMSNEKQNKSAPALGPAVMRVLGRGLRAFFMSTSSPRGCRNGLSRFCAGSTIRTTCVSGALAKKAAPAPRKAKCPTGVGLNKSRSLKT
jgi:hypothetical protein